MTTMAVENVTVRIHLYRAHCEACGSHGAIPASAIATWLDAHYLPQVTAALIALPDDDEPSWMPVNFV